MANFQDLIISGSFRLPRESGSFVGSIWYDEADCRVKYTCVAPSAVWVSAATNSTTRTAGGPGIGSRESTLIGGGRTTPPLAACVSTTEEFDGYVWSSGDNINASRYTHCGVGASVSTALIASGEKYPVNVNCTEAYDGVSWSNRNGHNTIRVFTGFSGRQNESLLVGGYEAPSYISCTEEYNGDTWSEVANLTTTRATGGAFGGSNNSSTVAGGTNGTRLTTTEHYNGTSWSTGANLPYGLSHLQTGGTENDGRVAGGFRSTPSATLQCNSHHYNGTTWSTDTNTLTQGRYNAGGGGTVSNNQIVAGGQTSPSNTVTNTTEYIEDDAYVSPRGVWTVASPLPTVRQSAGGAGTQNAIAVFGGFDGSAGQTSTDHYNGTSWSSGGNLNIRRANAVASGGIENAGILAGGTCTSNTWGGVRCTEEYNGATWAQGGLLPATSDGAAATNCGTQNSFAIYGGACGIVPSPAPNPPVSCIILEYNGTSWSAGATGNLCRVTSMFSSGTTNSMLVSAGWCYSSFPTAVDQCATQLYDGTSFSTNANMIESIRGIGAGPSATDATAIGASTSSNNKNFGWDGIAWQHISNKNCTNQLVGYQGSTTNSIAYGGRIQPSFTRVNHVETWTQNSQLQTSPLSQVSVYEAGPAIGTARYFHTATGTLNAALITGGRDSGDNVEGNTEEYNGTTWSEVANLNTSRCGLGGAGSQNATIVAGGCTPSGTRNSEEYDGTTWTEGNNLSVTARGWGSLAGTGTQNAALQFGSQMPAIGACTEEYNGTSWSTGGNMNCGRPFNYGGGTQNDAIAAGGCLTPISPAPHNFTNHVECYNGSSWEYAARMPLSSYAGSGIGNSNSFHILGGYRFPAVSHGCGYYWNGTTWSTDSTDIATVRFNASGTGASSDNGIITGGANPTAFTCTVFVNRVDYACIYNGCSNPNLISTSICCLN